MPPPPKRSSTPRSDGPRKPAKRQHASPAGKGPAPKVRRPGPKRNVDGPGAPGGPAGSRSRGPRGGGAGRPGPSAVDPARDAVFDALAVQVRRFPDLELSVLRTDGMSPLDEAFAHALYDAVIRRWLTLSFIVESALDRPDKRPDPRTIAAILAGAAQLLLLDKVPPHAAVNTSVDWVKTRVSEGAGRLVNAILRKIARLLEEPGGVRRETYTDKQDEIPLIGGGALALGAPILPEDTLTRLSVASSVPIELLRAWSKSSVREARRLALHTLVQPPVILNTSHATADLPQGTAAHTAPGHHVYSGTHAELSAMLNARKDIWVQDPASSLAVGSVPDLRPKLIVDACAGMGTKTRQLAATFPSAKIIATDVDMPRVRVLRGVSAHLPNVQVVAYDKLIDYAGKADLILLDVPCSNTGVLARRVEARYRFDREHLEKLASMQKQIIADSVRLLRRGSGTCGVLYSTCSLDPRENQAQADWACRWHGFRQEREHTRLPEGLPGDPPTAYSDGSYAVLLGS